LTTNLFAGAYYLTGYAVECALKSCIAKQINQYDFPDLKLIRDSYTHDLAKLLVVSELKTELLREADANPDFAVNWRTVTQWSEESRYVTRVAERVARDLYAAVTDQTGGILTWLKTWW
jgi:hypothetical protein